MDETEIRRGSCGVLVRDGRVLLGLRSPSAGTHHGQWDVIGGHREPGETDEQTMIRELYEELGVIPTQYERVGILAENFAETRYQICFFAVWDWHGTPNNSSHEHSEIAWFLPAEFSKLDLSSLSLIPFLSKIASGSSNPTVS